MFYASGYRFDFSEGIRKIVGTGGVYITAEADDVDIYLNEQLVDDARILRSASFVQNLNEGKHKVTVQKEGLYTWTKDLPVFPHIVTEAQAFNLPLVPQVRLISPYVTTEGEAVVFVKSSAEPVLDFASTTNVFVTSTSTATSTYLSNPEHDYVDALFASTSATSTSFIGRVVEGVNEAFRFGDDLASTTAEAATSTKLSRDMSLFRQGEEVYAAWEGGLNNIPYYYCIDYTSASSTRALYGDHVYESVEPFLFSPTGHNIIERNDRTQICRDQIRLDRKQETVAGFDFFPGSIDLVLLILDSGLHTVEIDDRAWQNTQLLYPGEDLLMVIDGGQIYIKDGELYLEVLTALEQ